MGMNNELIKSIDEACSRGTNVKAIRKQKHDPSNFYMTLEGGKQVGPIKCEGTQDVLNQKFTEAQAHLSKKATPRKAA
jgi:hypothetical protein